MARRRPLLIILTALLLGVTACGSDSTTIAESASAAGIRTVSPTEGDALRTNPDIIVLDVRTPEEFAGGHLDGALMIDFYEPDFADRIAELDPDGSYLIYCRSGNRSGQAKGLMESLGFADVADIDGGVIAWDAAGLPLSQ